MKRTLLTAAVAALMLAVPGVRAAGYSVALTGTITARDGGPGFYEACGDSFCTYSGAYSGVMTVDTSPVADGTYDGGIGSPTVFFGLTLPADYPFDPARAGPWLLQPIEGDSVHLVIRNGSVADFAISMHESGLFVVEASPGGVSFTDSDTHFESLDIEASAAADPAISAPVDEPSGLSLLAGGLVLIRLLKRTSRSSP